MNMRRGTLTSRDASWTSSAAAGVFTRGEPALIISQTVIKEAGGGSHLVGLELNKAGSREAADWPV